MGPIVKSIALYMWLYNFLIINIDVFMVYSFKILNQSRFNVPTPTETDKK